MVMIIIKIFLHLSTDPRFHSDLLSLHLLSLLNSSKLRDNENKEIKNIANDLFENMIKNNNSQKYTYIMQYDSEELKLIKGAGLHKQTIFLKNFEEALQQNKIKLDQLPEVDIELLFEVCKFETFGEDMDNSMSFKGDESDEKQGEHSASEIDKSDEENKLSTDNNLLHQKILHVLSILKALIRCKVESIKRKLIRFILIEFKTPTNLSKINEEIKYSLYEFYLEYFKANNNVVKDSGKILNVMFEINTSILNIDNLPSKHLMNVIEF